MRVGASLLAINAYNLTLAKVDPLRDCSMPTAARQIASKAERRPGGSYEVGRASDKKSPA